MNRLPILLTSLLWLLAGNIAQAAACPAGHGLQLDSAQFTTRIHNQQPQDRLLYLDAGAHEVYAHAGTRGAGRIHWRWLLDGKAAASADVELGPGAWQSWSRLRLPAAATGTIQLQLLSAGGSCLLDELTLPRNTWPDHPRIREALAALAANDATGARIALKLLLEEKPAPAAARAAALLLDTDVAIARTQNQLDNGELFLVATGLGAIERKLGRSFRDQALRERITAVRRKADLMRAQLRREDAHMAIAIQHLLATEKLIRGDYPLWREQAAQLLNPVLRRAGDHFALVDWQPTLRGYRLMLQDQRSGEAFEITPE